MFPVDKYYEVVVQDPSGEGSNHVVFFRHYATCIDYIYEQPNKNTYSVRQCSSVKIFDSMEEYEQFKLNEIRDRLMKTLTPIEKKALGLA